LMSSSVAITHRLKMSSEKNTLIVLKRIFFLEKSLGKLITTKSLKLSRHGKDLMCVYEHFFAVEKLMRVKMLRRFLKFH
jgi:hypothetical protein